MYVLTRCNSYFRFRSFEFLEISLWAFTENITIIDHQRSLLSMITMNKNWLTKIWLFSVAGTAPNVKVRLGEWDAAGTYEPISYQEYTVFRTFSHPSYDAGTLQYDITVVRLSTPVPFTPNAGSALTINRACLPNGNTASFVGQRFVFWLIPLLPRLICSFHDHLSWVLIPGSAG